MTTTKVPELRIRRVLYAPQDMIEKLHIQNDCKRKEAPAMLRRAYEFSVSCGKDGEDDARAPLFFHIRGERSTPLLRCLVIGAAVVGVIGIVGICTRVRRDLRIRRIYANRYAARLKAERLKRTHADA